MLIDIIDKLIDRIIQLAEWKKQSRKNLFNDFINPIFIEFEVVHNDYLDSFRHYRSLLRSSSVSLDSVCDTIKEDNIFTENRRNRLKELANAGNDATITRPFINSIIQYLTDPYDPMLKLIEKSNKFGYSGPEVSGNFAIGDISGEINQVYREPLRHAILVNEVKTEDETIEILDKIVLKLQERYSRVVTEYAKLKKSLLA